MAYYVSMLLLFMLANTNYQM